MEEKFTQQEILLVTGNGYLSREWVKKEETGKDNDQSAGNDKLEEACWNGLVQELLPEIFEKTADNKNLPLWSVRKTDSFLELELSDYPAAVDNYFSIDPYRCTSIQYDN